ncbi:globin domain-containing protein [Streptomyces sp. NPDC058254]|uniref:globin domain-containing protein n=1 Tax=Streptomyces sp. NPDC058254 TaxID=3346406 RepID=UPI0036E77F74
MTTTTGARPYAALNPALIRSSLAVVERRAEAVTKYFYAHLFKHNPGVRAMFPERMEEQRDRLFAALTTAILNLEDTGALVGHLRTLGFDHRKFGARTEHYPAVGDSLIATLKFFSGSAWTPKTEAAWRAAYELISKIMIAGAESVPESEPAWWDAEVLRHERRTDDIAVLTVRPDRPYRYLPGQYATLTAPEAPQVWRPYSIANAPRAGGSLDFHIRRVDGGLLSSALVDDVTPGGTVRLGPALGTTTLPEAPEGELLFVAGGTGWAQIKALIEQFAVCRGDATATLLIGARTEGDVYDAGVLQLLAGAHPWLRLVGALPPRDGTPYDADGSLLRELTRYASMRSLRHAPAEWPHVYVSGPSAMVETVETQLAMQHRVPPGRVHHDPVVHRATGERPETAAEWFLMKREVPWIRPRP